MALAKDISPRLYLIAPQNPDMEIFLPLLDQVCAAADIASLLLPLPSGDFRSRINFIKSVIPVTQRYDIAVVVTSDDDDDELVRTALRGGADGIHLDGNHQKLKDFREELGTEYILGAGGVITRDDAMLAGEKGADYIWFGNRKETDELSSLTQRKDNVSWWAEIFEPPCVTYARTWDEVDIIAGAKAEFVAAGNLIWNDTEGAAAAIVKMNDILRKYSVAE